MTSTPVSDRSRVPGDMRLRVLLLADSCNPDWISLPLVGWGHTRALHDLVDLHLVTHARNREGISKRDIPPERITYLDNAIGQRIVSGLSKVFRRNSELSWTTLTALQVPEYYLFEYLAWQQFKTRLQNKEFDVVHRLTPMSPVLPSEIAHRLKKIGVPFVVGPLNGGLPYPEQVKSRLWKEKDVLSNFRDAYKLLPLTSSTRRDASALLIAGKHVLRDVPQDCRDRSFYMPEIGFSPDRMTEHREGPVSLPIRIAATGRLVPLKGFDLLIRAAAPFIRAGQITIDLMGGGPEQGALEKLVADEGLQAGVKLHGWVEHQKLNQIMKRCDVFALPSLKELGGGAVVEGMATGLVPLTVDYGGPGEVVEKSFGFKVPMGTEAELIRDLAAVMQQLVDQPQLLIQKRDKARAFAFDRFSWGQKARQTLSVYQWVTGHGPKPSLEFPT